MTEELITIPLEAFDAFAALAREVQKVYQDAADWVDAKPHLTALASKAFDHLLGPTNE